MQNYNGWNKFGTKTGFSHKIKLQKKSFLHLTTRIVHHSVNWVEKGKRLTLPDDWINKYVAVYFRYHTSWDVAI